jgi:hypothetical protein
MNPRAMLYIIYIHDLTPQINISSEPIIFADDTSVIISIDNFDNFCAMANTLPSHMNKLFNAHRIALKLDKTNIITFTATNSLQYDLDIGYKGNYVKESEDTKLLGLQIDNHLNCANHIDKLIGKISGACYADR